MTASGEFQNASEQGPPYGRPQPPREDVINEAPPPPRTAVLLGLAFGASAGLMTGLYLLIF